MLVQVLVALDEPVRRLAHRGDVHELAHAHDRLRREVVGRPAAGAGAGVPGRRPVGERRRVEASAVGERVLRNPDGGIRVLALALAHAVVRPRQVPVDDAPALFERLLRDDVADGVAGRVPDLDGDVAALRNLDRDFNCESRQCRGGDGRRAGGKECVSFHVAVIIPNSGLAAQRQPLKLRKLFRLQSASGGTLSRGERQAVDVGHPGGGVREADRMDAGGEPGEHFHPGKHAVRPLHVQAARRATVDGNLEPPLFGGTCSPAASTLTSRHSR